MDQDYTKDELRLTYDLHVTPAMRKEQVGRISPDQHTLVGDRTLHLLSLTGLPGIFVGLAGTCGVLLAYWVIRQKWDYARTSLWLSYEAVILLFVAVGISVFFTARKARKRHEELWGPAARAVVKEMASPLAAGGVYTLILYRYEMISAIPGTMLIFYGLGLCAAAKYSRAEIRHLGWVEMVLGLSALVFTQQALLYWALGFGLAHVLYGALMYFKQEM
jgi:hypothetical protein